ncbi:hypothetical protein GC105_02635 [Alkalibaculum sp. M08DMB]|uniref:Uncharacterized protein n=1 Tax=Alkalibaculum sporogenes TaxID=2655001 RepID=A0A6A7K5S6_9FIRM|nr:hypothetical protein [Alkalibaculum sporogenes]MPW24691.1 hypothetical protein [Alkalibaculum sporogenes]
MEILLELVFEIVVEGIFAGVYYVFNKFFKDKVTTKTAKIISATLTAIIIVGAVIILIYILDKLINTN